MSACGTLRERLMSGAGGGADDHLQDCAGCRVFLARLESTRRGLVEHHASVEPDAQFAQRVAARIEAPETDPLAWAAWRFLPVGLALLVLLVSLSLTLPAVESEPESTPSILAWLASGEVAPLSKVVAVSILSGVFLLGVVVGVLGSHVAALHAPLHVMEHAASLDQEQLFLDAMNRAVDLSPRQQEEVRLIVQETHADAMLLHEELSPRVHALLSQAGERIESVLEPEQVAPFRHFAHEHHQRARHLLLGPGGQGTMR